MTETRLVQRCREGDREAQRALYDQTVGNVYRLLLKMTASPDDAMDLAQETYFKAFTKIGQFDGRSSIATWLYRVAVNEALQFLRRAGQARAKLPEMVPENSTTSDIERSTIKLDMDDALLALEPHDRAVLLLRYQEGLDYQAISQVVGCSTGTVASRLNRARGRLREILRGSYDQEEESGRGGHPKALRTGPQL